MSRSKPTSKVAAEAALAAMNADELRDLVHEMLGWLEDKPRALILSRLVDRAARTPGAWTPKGPTKARILKIEAHAEAAARSGWAEPDEVDEWLQEGQTAFLAKDYVGALRIYRSLFEPIADGEIQMGHHETVDEVLGTDVFVCAAQLVVSVYMTTSPGERAQAVLEAIEEADWAGYFMEPLKEIEKAAVEPLPGLVEFVEQWRALLADRQSGGRRRGWMPGNADAWLREFAGRQRGPEGLAELARKSRSSDDLRAWCRAVVETGDWRAALAAYEEAAGLVEDSDYLRADLLDGAALAVQELGGPDLDARLEQAWRALPSLLRLRCWLRRAGSREALRNRATEALAACPIEQARLRAFLHVLRGELAPAAKLLEEAPGLGWSSSGHPGHLLVPVLLRLLGNEDADPDTGEGAREYWSHLEDSGPRLEAPGVSELLERAAISPAELAKGRGAVLHALRTAAEHRAAGVTSNGRRRHYGHAAQLAVNCAATEASADAAEWLAELKTAYRRYPALQRAFGAARG